MTCFDSVVSPAVAVDYRWKAFGSVGFAFEASVGEVLVAGVYGKIQYSAAEAAARIVAVLLPLWCLFEKATAWQEDYRIAERDKRILD